MNRTADLYALNENFDMPSLYNPSGRSDLPGVDVFVKTIDPDREPPTVTTNTILSALVSTFQSKRYPSTYWTTVAQFLPFRPWLRLSNLLREVWVPFCRKHNIEPRNPKSYFNLKKDVTKTRSGLILHNREEELEERKTIMEKKDGVLPADMKTEVTRARWMADGTHWPGTWYNPTAYHSKGDHPGILQIMRKGPDKDPVKGTDEEGKLDFTTVDILLPLFAYVSLKKRKSYEDNKKAGAMNALVRATAILSDGPFILNMGYDQYICNSQFPQRFDGINLSDGYANNNTVFFNAAEIGLEEWWRNEQFWIIGGTSTHLVNLLQGLLKVITSIEIKPRSTSEPAAASENEDDTYADLYRVT
ncbi:UNVERIFIED_CONTAM: Cellulose synthase-like protein D1 [Sesamum indicum]